MEFKGYERPDGRVGIRNHVLVLPGGFVADEICRLVQGTVTMRTCSDGLGNTQRDRATIARHLVGLGQNPNVAAVLIAGQPTGGGLGYPELRLEVLAEQIAESGKRVELITVAGCGGTFECIQKGISIARELVREASACERRPFGLEHLCLGVKCGGSDTTSGIAGNPVLGHAYDLVVDAGGTCIFGEITEVIGAEHVLAKRAVNEEVGRQIIDAVRAHEEVIKASGNDIREMNAVPANITGGISSLEEKSLGAIYKAGTRPIQGVLKTGERPPGPGLYFMDNWEHTVSIFMANAAAGAQLNLYQMGFGGNDMGNLIMIGGLPVVTPLMHMSANPHTWARQKESLDFSSRAVVEGKAGIEETGEELLELIVKVAGGYMTKAETINYAPPVSVYTKDPLF